LTSRQLSFSFYEDSAIALSPQLAAAIKEMSESTEAEARGAVFTRPEVVDFILDLASYTKAQPLHKKRLLEPSFGAGNFLLPIVSRLLSSWRDSPGRLDDLINAIYAVELHCETFHKTYKAVVSLLQKEGFSSQIATDLVNSWLHQGDFLLIPLKGNFDFIIGNPPYVRQEMIPDPLLAEYRSRYQTIYDRADLYIPFIERSLSHLAPMGNMGFICADRWMKNRYGGPLRKLISEQFHLKSYVNMTDVSAFYSEVSAYPAITIISRETSSFTRIAHCADISKVTLKSLAQAINAKTVSKESKNVRELSQVMNGAEPWLLDSSDQMALIRRLEQQFPKLEDVGCKVGIGVATGADKVFIGDYEALNVEPDRKLPLVMTKDITSGEVRWHGQGVVNPFTEDGRLVNLHDYPCLSRYLNTHRKVIENRHCARKNPTNWYRTIDRIIPSLTSRPKLLIPDIKGKAHIVFERGELYPHHNLYYITSDLWDLRALQAVMLSTLTQLFIATYSTKMRGGFLRFQAQYLRRLRIPTWADVPEFLQVELINAAIKRDLNLCNSAVFKLYDLSYEERSVLGGNEA
jgi:hypothetical protein